MRINFRTTNGLRLGDLLNTGSDVPVHIPTPRNITIGDVVEFTYGDRTKPTSIGFVRVKHVHVWDSTDGESQNLIVVKE